MFNTSNIAPARVVAERKFICRSCPTKDFFRELQTCLKGSEVLDKHTKLKTNSCPSGHWEK